MRERPPETWWGFAQYVGLSDALSARCWQGIRASSCPTVIALRSTFLLHAEELPLDPRGLTRSSASPRHLIQVIEDLFGQQLLTAADRVAIEKIVLASTNARGQ